VRRGIRPNGSVYPAMPFPSYARVNDADMQALYAYSRRQVCVDWPVNLINRKPKPIVGQRSQIRPTYMFLLQATDLTAVEPHVQNIRFAKLVERRRALSSALKSVLTQAQEGGTPDGRSGGLLKPSATIGT
jgi:hypothetical protein